MYNNVLRQLITSHFFLNITLMLHQHYIGLFESECKKKNPQEWEKNQYLVAATNCMMENNLN